MAQFDVHRNGGVNRDSIPYVVVVQSSIFDDYKRRVVVPLVMKSYLGDATHPRFNPEFRIEETAVVLHPLEIVSVSRERLGAKVLSLADAGDSIIAALDELLSRTYE